MHEMAMFLAGRSRDAAAVKLRDGFPTAALARFRLDQEGWTELDPATATLERFDTPDRSA
jgi:phosphohistidine phosphatase SixA